MCNKIKGVHALLSQLCVCGFDCRFGSLSPKTFGNTVWCLRLFVECLSVEMSLRRLARVMVEPES